MQKYSCYLLPHSIDFFLEKEQLPSFIHRIEGICLFILQNKKIVDIEMCGDITSIEALGDLDVYEAKALLGLFLDNGNLFNCSRKQNTNDYNYFLAYNKNYEQLKLVLEDPYIELFERRLLSKAERNLNFISTCDLDIPLSIIRIKKFFPYEQPILQSIEVFNTNIFHLEVLFISVLQEEFEGDTEKYQQFKDVYLKFYRSYDWGKFNPYEDAFPAHSVLDILRKIHSPCKDDSYLQKWGSIMAFLNGGRFNHLLTQHNEKNKKVNRIFQSGSIRNKSILFLSIDLENGNLEIYDNKGKHMNIVYGIQTGIKKQPRPYTIDVPETKWLPDY